MSAGTNPLSGERTVLIDSVPIEVPGNERSERAALKEAERRRIKMLADADELKVAHTIRPTGRASSDEATPSRDWQHRWVVRMHKVRQWYPSEQRHRVIYRGLYVKGPVGKPLLGGEVVRNLARPLRSDR
jgi:hypothetical protein